MAEHRSDPRNEARRLTAFHEAGHALATMRWRGPFAYVTIEGQACVVGRADDNAANAITAWAFGESELTAREVRIWLAGLAGESICTGAPPWRIVALGFPDEIPFDDRAEDDVPQARARLLREHPALDARELAARLLAEYEIVRAFLERHRAVLETVATALEREGRLDYERVRALVGRELS